jgi:NH3-dependent NAD+ synthetase
MVKGAQKEEYIRRQMNPTKDTVLETYKNAKKVAKALGVHQHAI